MIAPYLDECYNKTGVVTLKINVDELGELCAKYNITAMPTFKLLDS
jgi:hypothetical protein